MNHYADKHDMHPIFRNLRVSLLLHDQFWEEQLYGA